MPAWRRGYDPGLVAKRIEKTKTVSANGAVSFSGFDHREHVLILSSMLELNTAVPELEQRRILNLAIFAAGAKGVITADSILRHAWTLEAKYLRKPRHKYKLLTDISIARQVAIPRFTLAGVAIMVNARLNRKTQNHRIESIRNARHSITSDPPTNYSPVCVSVSARSPSEAAEIALDKLDFLRGIWNLSKNRRESQRTSSGKRAPVNSILLGPIHTLHEEDGKPATDSWWYEPSYQGPVQNFSDSQRIESMLKYTENFRVLLKKSNYQSDIVTATLRYVRALDTRDWNDTFLRLWGVLEFLTATQSDSYKVTIRRAAFMFADRDYVMQMLSHLMNYRNKFVHAGSQSMQIESLMYQLKSYVETLLEFHLHNSVGFVSIADAAEFMDLPSDREEIDERIRKLHCAKKFVGGT